jgi:hypothetical protein
MIEAAYDDGDPGGLSGAQPIVVMFYLMDGRLALDVAAELMCLDAAGYSVRVVRSTPYHWRLANAVALVRNACVVKII